jgi:RNA polymerase sigma factor (sigma-70 family)
VQLEPHRALLFDVAYRITGTVADAEDLVQESFARALASPPPDLERPLRPWLVRVVANLARDQLRARRRRAYPGSWLPGPQEVDELAAPEPGPEGVTARREAVGWATLVALESLPPQQRAVLVLREVADLSAAEVADALATTPEAVRAAHARARRTLAAVTPREPAALDAATLAALQRLTTAILTGDLAALREVLTADVQLASDSGGAYRSAVRVLHGADHVARFLLGISRKNGPTDAALVRVNDRFALRTAPERPPRGVAPRGLLVFTLAPDGRVSHLAVLVSPRKLQGLH